MLSPLISQSYPHIFMQCLSEPALFKVSNNALITKFKSLLIAFDIIKHPLPLQTLFCFPWWLALLFQHIWFLLGWLCSSHQNQQIPPPSPVFSVSIIPKDLGSFVSLNCVMTTSKGLGYLGHRGRVMVLSQTVTPRSLEGGLVWNNHGEFGFRCRWKQEK